MSLKRAELTQGRRALLVSSPLLVIVWLLALSWPVEPTYQGKTLSHWLRESPQSPHNADSPIRAQEALNHLGTNAIPLLLKWLRTHDPTIKKKLVNLGLRLGVITSEKLTRESYPFKSESYYHGMAANGLRLLGPKALPALPELVALMNRGDSSGDSAAYALAGIGAEAVPPLIALLDDPDERVRYTVVSALGEIRKRPDLTVPALVDRLEKEESYVRVTALNALWYFGPDAKAAIPVLTKLANDKEYSLRGMAVMPVFCCALLAGVSCAGQRDCLSFRSDERHCRLAD